MIGGDSKTDAIEVAVRKHVDHGRYPLDPLSDDGHSAPKITDILAAVKLGSPRNQCFDYAFTA